MIERLSTEYEQLRTELTDIVNGIDGGADALTAALEIIDDAKENVDAYIERRARGAERVSPREGAEDGGVQLNGRRRGDADRGPRTYRTRGRYAHH